MTRNPVVLMALFSLPLLMQPQTSKPLWEVDLSKFDYQGRPPAALAHLPPSVGPMAGWANQQGVVFTGPKVVAVYFVVHDEPPGTTEPREPTLSDPFRLTALFLNASNGELIKKLDWPLPANPQAVAPSFFFSATNGQFVVGLGSTLDLYSSDFKLLHHFDAQSELSPIMSPSGESLLLSDTTVSGVDGQWNTRYDLLDTGTLSVTKSWSEAATRPPHTFAALCSDERAWVLRSSLYLATPSSAPKELLANKGELCGSWSFINQRQLAGPTCGEVNKLLTVSTDGKVVWDFDLGFEQLDGPIVASISGQRFAVPTMRWGSARNNEPDQIKARIFSAKSANPLMTLSVPRSSGWGQGYFYGSYGDTRFGWGGLALSQDGGLVGVKFGAEFRVYRVPEPGSTSQCTDNCNDKANLASSRRELPKLTGVSSPSAPLIEQMLNWLPVDTETVSAVMGPFLLPPMEKDSSGSLRTASSRDEVRDQFMRFPLWLLVGKDGLLAKNLKDEPIVAEIEGSRSFQAPTGLGGMRYQGGVIAVFAGNVTANADAFLRDSASGILRKQQIEGHQVTVFQEKSEVDIWTTYVAFPKPNVAVVATNEDYLREVLARINGKQGARALPANLPEWKHVNIHAEFWAVRHYQKTGAEQDPSSPFNRGWGKTSDPQAIGLTFSFDPDKSKVATITYLSRDETSLQRIKREYFAEHGPAETQMHIQYREIEAGALEGTYNIEQLETADAFAFVLEGLLGHAIYL
jgi:hypothetical protein